MLTQSRRQTFHRSLSRSCLPVILWLMLVSPALAAVPLSNYHQRIKQAVTALETVGQIDESETTSDYAQRDAETVDGVLRLLPRSEPVEWNGRETKVDNSWLHDDLNKYRGAKLSDRPDVLRRVKERLSAIDERITEAVSPGTVAAVTRRRIVPGYAKSLGVRNTPGPLSSRMLLPATCSNS